MDKIAIIVFPRNIELAKKIQEFINGDILIYSKDVFKEAFKYNSIIPIMAIGIVVREIAHLIKNKWTDPAIVVIDSGLNFAIPILGGHHGGNELAKKLGEFGLIPVITTATEVNKKESVEKIASKLRCEIFNKDSTKKVNLALLDSELEVFCVKGPKILVVDDDVSILKKNGLVVGIGANSGVESSEVRESIIDALSQIGADIDDVKFFASAEIKRNEKGIIEAADSFGKEIKFISHEIINSIDVPSDSKAKLIGLNGVCEPAAIFLSCEKKLLLKKRCYKNVTIAIAK